MLAANSHVLCTVALLSSGLGGLVTSTKATSAHTEGRISSEAYVQLAVRVTQEPEAKLTSTRDLMKLAKVVRAAAVDSSNSQLDALDALDALARVTSAVNRQIADAVSRFSGKPKALLALLVAISLVAQDGAANCVGVPSRLTSGHCVEHYTGTKLDEAVRRAHDRTRSHVAGCTDPSSTAFDVNADVDDGSCTLLGGLRHAAKLGIAPLLLMLLGLFTLAAGVGFATIAIVRRVVRKRITQNKWVPVS